MTATGPRPPTRGTDPGTSPAAYGLIRDDAIARLHAWHPPDPAQERLRQDYLAHLARHADAMARGGPPAHLTGSVIVLDPAGEHVLLTLHQKARRWFQFGGHFEPGDRSMRQGAEREAREESGIDGLVALPEIVMLDRHDLGAAFGRCQQHLDVRYAAVAPPGAMHAASPESVEVRWWPADHLPEDTRAELLPVVRAAQAMMGR
ncbi:NUDIX domain-containing protein [Intrasporangium sp.]|uniref:NUDIX hydrolase n=1 Tax=Intrasporangium sp. TaxID=1925024 RepID=UPI0033658219